MYLVLQDRKYQGPSRGGGARSVPSKLKSSLSRGGMIDFWPQAARPKLFLSLGIDPSSSWFLKMPFDF